MEIFFTLVALVPARHNLARLVQHITMPFPPRSVVDFGHHAIDVFTGGIEAVIKTHRVKAVPEVTQVREQPYRACKCVAGLALHQIAHCLIQRHGCVAQMIGAVKVRQCAAARRP